MFRSLCQYRRLNFWGQNQIFLVHKISSRSQSRRLTTTTATTTSSSSFQQPPRSHEEKMKQVEEMFQKYRADQPLVGGVAIAICAKNQPTTFFTNGIADFETNTSVSSQTVFRFGNITMSLTAAAILQLYEAGKFNFDDPANNYLSNYKIVSNTPVTIKHLLTHTSGLPRLKYKLFRRFKTQQYYDKRITSDLKTTHDVGLFDLSFLNYIVLSDIIETVSGMPFETYIKQNIMQRLGMKSSGYSLNDDSLLRINFAPSYMIYKTRTPIRINEKLFTLWPRRAWGLLSSITDMSLFLESLLNEGANSNGRILQPNSVKLMMEPQFQLHPKLPGLTYGFAWDLYESSFPVAHLDTQMLGYEGTFFILPKHDCGFVIISNYNEANVKLLVLPLVRILTGTKYPERIDYQSQAHSLILPKLVGIYMDPITKGSAVHITVDPDGSPLIHVKEAPGKLALLRPADQQDFTLWVFNTFETLILKQHYKAMRRIRKLPPEQREKLQQEIEKTDSLAIATAAHSNVYLVADITPKNAQSSNLRDVKVDAVLVGFIRYPRLVRSTWYWIFEAVLVIGVLIGIGFLIAHFI